MHYISLVHKEFFYSPIQCSCLNLCLFKVVSSYYLQIYILDSLVKHFVIMSVKKHVFWSLWFISSIIILYFVFIILEIMYETKKNPCTIFVPIRLGLRPHNVAAQITIWLAAFHRHWETTGFIKIHFNSCNTNSLTNQNTILN